MVNREVGMSKYLIVEFNRYHTEKSNHTVVEAEGHMHALHQLAVKEDWDEDETRHMVSLHEEVSPAFSCVALEEEDILIYRMDAL